MGLTYTPGCALFISTRLNSLTKSLWESFERVPTNHPGTDDMTDRISEVYGQEESSRPFAHLPRTGAIDDRVMQIEAHIEHWIELMAQQRAPLTLAAFHRLCDADVLL